MSTSSLDPRRLASAPRAPRAGFASSGFTLLELMVVMTILGFVLLLLPGKLDNSGARYRLESTANTLVSVLTAAREMAIIDGHETRVQFQLPGSMKDRDETGSFRYLITSRQHQKSKALQTGDGSHADDQSDDEQVEDEWIETEWRPLAQGVLLAGFSVKPAEWIKSNPRGDPVEVSFFANGTVRPACALRLVSVDLPSNAANTLTVRINALTASAEILEGEVDLPKDRDSGDFK